LLGVTDWFCPRSGYSKDAKFNGMTCWMFICTENGVFYRQWWLANERTILFITYQCDPEAIDIETEVIDKIVQSITVNNAQTR